MTDQALRYNQGKPRLDMVLSFGSALEKLAAVMEQGAIKYEEDNWLLGGKPDNEYIAAAMRHLEAVKNGREFDEDLGVHAMAQVAWNALAFLRLNRHNSSRVHPEFDQAAFVAKYRGEVTQGPAPAGTELLKVGDRVRAEDGFGEVREGVVIFVDNKDNELTYRVQFGTDVEDSYWVYTDTVVKL